MAEASLDERSVSDLCANIKQSWEEERESYAARVTRNSLYLLAVAQLERANFADFLRVAETRQYVGHRGHAELDLPFLLQLKASAILTREDFMQIAEILPRGSTLRSVCEREAKRR